MQKTKQKLKVLTEDIPLISDYLHDANIAVNTINYDMKFQTFSMEINRISYEDSKKSKKFGIIPIVNYPTIVSLLSVSEVSEMRVKWSDDVFKDDVGYPHSFHEILLDNDKSIKIYSDYFEIVLLLSSTPEIILEDISEPSEENGVTDIGGSVFVGIEEIINLKI